ncbi:MAG TPA: glycosyl hydrolase, partial [Planctomycetota bacterium]|nr:glycosyl hydrolase [Planctomycetota bacterium]
LERSEHVGKILIHPTKPDVVYVAAQGPLWSSGGERGLYKTEDGGKTWRRILHVSDDAGVSEVVADPRDPDVLYAAAYQRRRHVWTLHDGGPDSGLYKSTDGGATWSKLARGLPTVHMGRIGLAIPPTKGSRVYAIVEAQEGASGVYVSENAGATFEKRSSYVSTSPQYYQELVCCPHDADRVYSLDTYLHVSDDAGRTWRQAGEADKHVDNHALIVDPADPDHLLVGCDGGLYESFDRARTWRFFPNLPLAQFYRVTVDDSEPFFFVYGGTQDNNTLGAPSRTASASGVVNADWFVTVGGDGFTARVEPGEPNVVYSEWQHGGLIRFDRRTGEALDIKPRPDLGEEGYRWNWDAPFLISPHRKTRLWFGAERVFRSDDRGDSWTVASGDLTRRLDRDTLQVMGRWWAMDAVAKHDSTSHYGNLLALDESPRVEGLLYAGSDDGLIHVTEDGGANWRRIDAFPGVPDLTPCVALVASRHAADAVYAVFGNHRAGDFKPYVLRSDDRGRTWRSIAGDLPERGNVWCLAEDHVRPDLLWVGAEFGLWTTFDGGARWHRLKAGLPPAPVRDLAIQRRDDALVAATFGRGLHVIDDLAPLRAIAAGFGDAPSALLDARDAKLFVPARPLGGGGRGAQGSSYFTAPNPEFGVAFHVYLRDAFKSKRSVRREEEKKLEAETRPVPRPTFDEVREERREESAQVVVEILDASGALVRRLSRDAKRGL